MSFVSNSTGSFFNRSLAQMASLRGGIERAQTQIATGSRIERGSDDPAAAAQLRSVARRERLASVEGDNAAQLGQDLAAASEEVEAVKALLQRARTGVAGGEHAQPLVLEAARSGLPPAHRPKVTDLLDMMRGRSNGRS